MLISSMCVNDLKFIKEIKMASAQNVRNLVSGRVATPPSEGFGVFKTLLHLFQNLGGVLDNQLHLA